MAEARETSALKAYPRNRVSLTAVLRRHHLAWTDLAWLLGAVATMTLLIVLFGAVAALIAGLLIDLLNLIGWPTRGAQRFSAVPLLSLPFYVTYVCLLQGPLEHRGLVLLALIGLSLLCYPLIHVIRLCVLRPEQVSFYSKEDVKAFILRQVRSKQRSSLSELPPLHVAAAAGPVFANLVQTLIDMGADPCMRDAGGRTPLDVARECRNEAAETILKKQPSRELT